MIPIPYRRRLENGLALATVQHACVCDKMADGGRIIIDCPVMLLGIRQGSHGRYDDVLCFVRRDGEARCWPGNTQPGRTGWRAAISKYYPQLRCGLWPSIRGRHRLRPNRFRQPTSMQATNLGLFRYFHDQRRIGCYQVDRMSSPTTIERSEWGTFSINVHDGGETRTGSAGCITAPPDAYFEMRDMIYAAMNAAGQKWLPLVVVAGPL